MPLEIIDNCVQCAGNELQEFAHHKAHVPILAMPGANVMLRKGSSIPANSHDLRVVESLLIQSRGLENTPPCDYCNEGKGIYAECITLAGYWGNACGSCKRNDKAIECSLSDTQAEKKVLREEIKENVKEMVTKSGRKTKAPVSYSR